MAKRTTEAMAWRREEEISVREEETATEEERKRAAPRGLPLGSGFHLQSDGKPYPRLLICKPASFQSLSGGAEAQMRLPVLLPVSLGAQPVLECQVPGLGALPGSLRKKATG